MLTEKTEVKNPVISQCFVLLCQPIEKNVVLFSYEGKPGPSPAPVITYDGTRLNVNKKIYVVDVM